MLRTATRQPHMRRAARITLRCSALLVMALTLAGCDKCGRPTPINKPWTSACDFGPTTR